MAKKNLNPPDPHVISRERKDKSQVNLTPPDPPGITTFTGEKAPREALQETFGDPQGISDAIEACAQIVESKITSADDAWFREILKGIAAEIRETKP